MRFSAVLTALPAFAAFVLASPAAAAEGQLESIEKRAGGFISACNNCGLLNDHTLSCQCATNNKNHHAVTSLDLNQCMTNHDGTLIATPNGDFGASCSGSSLSGTTFTTHCGGSTTSINLNDFVDDSNGFLHCFSSTACCISGTCSNPPGNC